MARQTKKIKTSDARNVASKIKALVLDADGVIFSGSVLVSVDKKNDGNFEYKEVFKKRSHIDGQGISLLRSAGICIAIITAEKTGFAEALCQKLNRLPSVESGKWPAIDCFTDNIGKIKERAIGAWLEKLKIDWSECAYMGDDVGDFEVMKKVGFPACPNQAEKIIKDISFFIAKRDGGNGAIRDLANMILSAKKIDPTKLNLR